MKYLIIGLGNYGRILAIELSHMGHEVIGVDRDMEKVEALKDFTAQGFKLDVTEGTSWNEIPLKSVDVVIVAIGKDFTSSIRTVALLKQQKVKHIYARAIDDVHRSILDAFELDKVLTPEDDAAYNLVREMAYGPSVEVFRLDENYSVVKFAVPENLVGQKVSDTELLSNNLKVLAIMREKKTVNCLGISRTETEVLNELPEDFVIEENDRIACYGRHRDFEAFWKSLNKLWL